MNIKPLRDNVVVKMNKAEDKSPGGLILPDTAKEKPSEGEVLAVGPGILNDDGTTRFLVVKIGDKVVFSKYYTPLSMPDCDDLVIMNETNILAIKI